MDFVPIAEENGMMLQIGEWVLREASRQARAWLRAHGCREVQGFLFSQPLAPERFARLLKVHGVGGVEAPDWPVPRSRSRADARRGLQAG